jgi:prepilin-type N-terminal cleavage/methylation domain-containing protein
MGLPIGPVRNWVQETPKMNGNALLNRGFTLIELLVVIAIIAILAAILFPVFAQAKEAAKKTQLISNTKQMATSFLLYAGDFDDRFPLMKLHCSSGLLCTSGGDFPADYRNNTPDWLTRHGGYWAEATHPYVKNRDMLIIGHAPVKLTTNTPLPGKKPGRIALTPNGLIHGFSQNEIIEVSKIPMLWFGRGFLNFEGFGNCQPQLRCALAPTITCRFQSGIGPQGVADTFGHVRITQEAKAAMTTDGNISVRTDTSAKYFRLAKPGTSGQVNLYDPFASYDANGLGTASVSCRRPGETSYYWCHFRPDWDFTFTGWEIL